jgi:non-specific serine/threonine protein kinase
MYRLGLGACLADDMGLGKTIQVIGLFLLARRARQKDKNGRAAPSVVVVPASLVANWRAELEAFAPSLSVIYAHPSETTPDIFDQMGRDSSLLSETDLVITSYSMLSRLPWLRDARWDVAVLDEAQAIKNPSARRQGAEIEGADHTHRYARREPPVGSLVPFRFRVPRTAGFGQGLQPVRQERGRGRA